MTTVTFYKSRGSIVGFDAAGHSGYAEEGADIVCAAITSAVRLTECILNDVMNLHAAVGTETEGAWISLRLPVARREDAQNALTGLCAYLHQLALEYPGFLRVREKAPPSDI